ncbi:hypothetical protein [Bradyrhizobium sp. 613_E4_N2_2]|uniref:hypothetical protein n=1 Tax=Bradyrhizobium sp. 613_E4_N2_2 TaxID=3240371 RepID=UPI003F8B97AE
MDKWADAPGERDAITFLKEREDCLAEAAKSDIPSAKAQWLMFADEWLKLAQAARAQRSSEEAAMRATVK